MARYDLAIVGGGPAGHAAAKEAARLGLSACLVERGHLGGTCLNWGCIPTKLLLGATEPLVALNAAKKLKAATGEIAFDPAAMAKRNERYIAASRKAVASELAELGVDLIRGEARFTGPGALVVDGRSLAFDRAVVATGSRPGAFPGMEPDGAAVLDSDQLLDSLAGMDRAPESLLVVGAGAIGLEMADVFWRLGAKITLVEALPRLAPTEEPEVGEALYKLLKRDKHLLHVGARVASLATAKGPGGGRALCFLEDGTELTADKALVAVGRRPNSRDLGLESVGAKTSNHGFIETDGSLLAAPGVYAAGDVNGRLMLAHAAEDQAAFCVRHAAGKADGPYATAPFRPVVPACVYGRHEIMRAGPTVAALQAAGHEVAVSEASMAANAMAQAHGAPHGMVRCAWVEGRLASVSALGHGVSRLAAAATVMVQAAWRPDDARAMVFAHPGLEEALKAALLANSRPI